MPDRSELLERRALDAPAHGAEPLRQLSLDRYGLAGLGAGALTAELQPLTLLAQQVFDADFAAVHILDGARQVRVAASTGTPLTVSRRSTSVCHELLSKHEGSTAFLTEDARVDPLLQDARWMGSEDVDVRFYAAAPLIGREGVPLGALCVWSTMPAAASDVRRLMLEELAQRVMDVLDVRRAGDGTLPAPRRASCDLSRENSPKQGEQPAPWTIEKVIEERAVHTLFQPIVHLESGAVVGFEALTRGPQDSALQSPMALLNAAAAAGCLGELDWLCRVSAMQAAADSGLHRSLSWFINVEPAGLDTPCPDHLLPTLAHASTDLRVVFELVERGIQNHVTKLLRISDEARRNAWGIALDDVGARKGSLAVLPLLQPDVVKLDMSLMDPTDRHAATEVIAGVSAYAERRGAVILAEGIETEEQERMARVFGAQYGQGYRFGRPGPLPDSVPAPRHVIPLRQQLEPLDDSTPFEVLSTHRQSRRAMRAEITHIAAWLQERAANPGEPGVVLANFQHTQHFTDAAWTRLNRIADSNALTVVFALDVPDAGESSYHTVALAPGSSLGREWVIIVLRPHYAAAFAARDCGDQTTRQNRRFDYLVTHNRDLVIAAARALLHETDRNTSATWHTHHDSTFDAVETPLSDEDLAGNHMTGPRQPSRNHRPALRSWFRRR